MPVDVELMLSPSPIAHHSHMASARSSPTSFLALAAAAATSAAPHSSSSLWHNKHHNDITATAPVSGMVLLSTSTCSQRRPVRPCLIIRALPQTNGQADGSHSEAVSPPPGSSKKRVVFADDRGMTLTHVRVMREPSDCPPRWTNSFLAQVTQGAIFGIESGCWSSQASTVSTSTPWPWQPSFAQPASDYLAFRDRLERLNVALENAVVPPPPSSKSEVDAEMKPLNLIGTIKVKNLSYNKEVFVRITFDNWKTQQDVFATYVQAPPVGGAVSLLDTFSFRHPLPPDKSATTKTTSIEFCVCYRCEDHEFWDNNSGENYVIKKVDAAEEENPWEAKTTKVDLTANGKSKSNNQQRQDAMRLGLDTWTEFASWHHLSNEGPYW